MKISTRDTLSRIAKIHAKTVESGDFSQRLSQLEQTFSESGGFAGWVMGLDKKYHMEYYIFGGGKTTDIAISIASFAAEGAK